MNNLRRMTASVLMAVLLIWACGAAAAGAIAVVTGDAGGITLVRDGQAMALQPGDSLYGGDVLRGPGAASLSLKLHPCAQVVADSADEAHLVLQPVEEKTMWTKVKEFFGFVNAETGVTSNMTRGRDDEDEWLQPGLSATLLPGRPAVFAWGVPGVHAVTVQDSTGQTIFRRDTADAVRLTLTPEEMGLKPGGDYIWLLQGIRAQGMKLKMADEVTARKIADDMARLEAEASGRADAALKQAMYLQFTSDMSGGRLDLYWLSYQLAIEAEANGGSQAVSNVLRRSYGRHLEEAVR